MWHADMGAESMCRTQLQAAAWGRKRGTTWWMLWPHLIVDLNIVCKAQKPRNHEFGAIADCVDGAVLDDQALIVGQHHLQGHDGPAERGPPGGLNTCLNPATCSRNLQAGVLRCCRQLAKPAHMVRQRSWMATSCLQTRPHACRPTCPWQAPCYECA